MKHSAFHFMAHHTGALILAQARGNHDTVQATWRQTVQGEFLDWLSAGGFQAEQEDDNKENNNKEDNSIEDEKNTGTNENSGTAAAVSQSQPGTQCEELKFTRVRIIDAVG